MKTALLDHLIRLERNRVIAAARAIAERVSEASARAGRGERLASLGTLQILSSDYERACARYELLTDMRDSNG